MLCPDPSEARVAVPDERYDFLCDFHKPARSLTIIIFHYILLYVLYYSKVPAFLQVVDIAGLVKGAHEGQGLGNAFLSHIGACDAIFHVVRKSPWLTWLNKKITINCVYKPMAIKNIYHVTNMLFSIHKICLLEMLCLW